MDNPRFESLGVYLPEKIVTTQALIDQMEEKPLFDLEDLTGIRERRWRGDDEDSLSLAMCAAKKCLNVSQYKATDIDIIISCSITRFKGGLNYLFEPALSKSLKSDLGMRPSAINFDITNACAGMMSGVSIVYDMIKAGVVKSGMVVSGECITPITETAIKEIKDPIDAQLASLTVGDSGAACIIDNAMDDTEGFNVPPDLFCVSEYADLCFGMPSAQHSGVAMYTDSMAIHKESIERLPVILQRYMQQYGLSVEDFDFAIPHQTSTRAIDAGVEACIPVVSKDGSDYFPEVVISLDRYGNTSSTSHFVALYDYIKQGKIQPGARILFLIMASGIMLGAVAATIGDIKVD
ncbi:MAG: 3-oxoacyl-[acyl-carrier-protein] synthase III C-terminal domain-containing protein [Myxococcota bacterium]|nr:3-oxoacyl-[acyl-carrier-protein] synthase III C-terminal domain-containing protein [Myxococcota bacterium]